MQQTQENNIKPMENKKNLIWAAVAALLAVIFNYLFFDKIFGISVPIYGALLLLALFVFSKQQKINFKPVIWLGLAFLFFCLTIAFRSNQALIMFDALVAFGLFLLIIRSLVKENILNFSFLDYILTALIWPIKLIGRGFVGVAEVLRGAKTKPVGKSRQALIGILISIPVLLFFGTLFLYADLAFRNFIQNLFSFNLPNTFVPQAVFTGIAFIGVLGVFTYLRNPVDKIAADVIDLFNFKKAVDEDRNIEVAVFLSLIAGLFLLFIGFQIHYLFGGTANIVFNGLTYAEYARKGFWELLIVAFSTFLILFAVDDYTKHYANRKRWFVIPSMILVVEVLVIMISAFKRLALYQAAYGMTNLRLIVFGFIFLLATILVILAIKIVKNKQHSFLAFGVLVTILVFVAGFNILNPDKFVASWNVKQFSGTDKLDAWYLSGLSADAASVILNDWKPSDTDSILAKDSYMQRLKSDYDDHGQVWQSWSLSRHNAYKLLKK